MNAGGVPARISMLMTFYKSSDIMHCLNALSVNNDTNQCEHTFLCDEASSIKGD